MQTGMNQLKKLLMFLIVGTVICCVETGHTFELWNGDTTSTINLRESPGLDGKIITGIQKGKKGLIKDKHGDWYQIIFEYNTYGYKGWVYGKYIKKVNNEERDNLELINEPYERLLSPKNPPLVKEAGTKQSTEREPLKPLTEKSSMVDSFEKEGEKIEPIDESQENRPSSKSLPVEKILEERKSMIATVSENSNQHKGLSSFTGLFLIVLSIALFCFALLFFYKASQLTQTNNDLSIQFQRIKTKLEEKKVGLKEKRKHPRFAGLIEADFVVQERAYKGFIKNVSSGGAYIETKEPFSVGQKIVLAFPSPNREGHIKMTGAIARSAANGIAILFENNL